MKSFLLAILAGLLLSPVAYAGSGVFFDPDRDGEGITVFEDLNDGRLALIFYTYNDNGYDIYPTVSPAPPPSPLTFTSNAPNWITCVATDWNGISGSGTCYISVAISYPSTDEDGLNQLVKVATINIEVLGDGYSFEFTRLGTAVPESSSWFSTTYDFDVAIING